MRFQESDGAPPAPASEFNGNGAGPAPWRMVAILGTLTAIHVGAFVSWQSQRHASSADVPATRTALVFVNVAAPQPARKLETEVSATPAAPIARRRLTLAVPATPTGAAESPVPAQPLPAENAPEVPDLLERAKASARRLAPEMVPATKTAELLTLEHGLGNAIAAAARPRTTTIEELQTADGRPLSKIGGPRGTYCVMRDGFGPSAGRDPFRDGARDRVVACPR